MTDRQADNQDVLDEPALKTEYVGIEEWRAEAARLFGDDPLQWRFVCPSCGYEASVQAWKDAGAPESTAAFSCIGRWTGSRQELGTKAGGPCNYAGGGLFALNPVKIGGRATRVFQFGEARQHG